MTSPDNAKTAATGTLSRRAILDGVALAVGAAAAASLGPAVPAQATAATAATDTAGPAAPVVTTVNPSTPSMNRRRSTMSTIKRSTPDVGYIDPAFYKSINVSQTVRVNDTVHFSGIVAATGQGEVVAKGDAAGQIRAVLRTLERLLAEENMDFSNLVSTTVYATDVDAIGAQLALFAAAFEGHPPTMTMIEVKRLASPDYLLELVAIAAL